MTTRLRALSLTPLIAMSVLALSSAVAQAGIKHAYTGQQITEAPPGNALARPWGLTFDSSGNLYVADTGEGLVDVFNPTNEFTTQLGSGLLDTEGLARSVTVNDATGDVYVADSGPNTVLVFKPDSKGKYEPPMIWEGAKTELDEQRFHGQIHVAVDNSNGPRKGDVYVATFQDVFAQKGVVVVFKPGPSGEEGIVVEENNGPAGGFEFEASLRNEGVAIQDHPGPVEGDLYVTDTTPTNVAEKLTTVDVFNDAGTDQPLLAPIGGSLSEEFFPSEAAGAAVALDDSTGEVYVADTAHDVVDQYSATGEFLGAITGTCPSPGTCPPGDAIPFGDVLAVAVDPLNGNVYVSDGADNVLDIFGPDILPAPPVIASQASLSVTQTTAIVRATINPHESNTTYHFEWGESAAYGAIVPLPDGAVGAGLSDINVGQQLLGLQPGTTYHFTVVATNSAGSTPGSDQTFTTPPPEPPVVQTGVAGAITQSSASVSGTIDPRGFYTTYEFDLGTDTGYGSRVFANAGSSSGPGTVTQVFQGLAPEETYHFRLVASNLFGTSYGADQTFTTPGFPTATLSAPATAMLLALPSTTFPTGSSANTAVSKPLTNAQKLARALRACRKKPKRKRASCARRARSRYRARRGKGRR